MQTDADARQSGMGVEHHMRTKGRGAKKQASDGQEEKREKGERKQIMGKTCKKERDRSTEPASNSGWDKAADHTCLGPQLVACCDVSAADRQGRSHFQVEAALIPTDKHTH